MVLFKSLLPKTGDFDEDGRNHDFAVNPQKQQGALPLRPWKPTKMTRMAGIIHAKPPFA